MVNQQQVDRLTEELEDLRGAVVRDGQQMSDRVEKLLREARELHQESHGTAFEPALRSVENLLGCVQRGLLAKSSLRKAG
ncbi:hypothetical protein [Algisphaera agarilytica]|uniref:Uncharacterized protein n=1 Tax=Algisphaera agarilytica TaxID=1385975 RepID=A0A7X0H7P1_9BACT|nr:hypothetical protein [Algisphaera agarilytica]MBB6430633.1 hypothetical protein [Algisphaera agarilytica]